MLDGALAAGVLGVEACVFGVVDVPVDPTRSADPMVVLAAVDWPTCQAMTMIAA